MNLICLSAKPIVSPCNALVEKGTSGLYWTYQETSLSKQLALNIQHGVTGIERKCEATVSGRLREALLPSDIFESRCKAVTTVEPGWGEAPK